MNIFLKTFFISAFTFGGGYIVIPMIRKYFVEELKTITEEELVDMAAVSQSSPGAIAVNLAVLVAHKTGGPVGALLAAIGTTLPPLIILSVISGYYSVFRDNSLISAVLKGMEAGVAATIVDLIITMTGNLLKERDWFLVMLAPLTFIASFVFKINVFLIILVCAVLSLLKYFISHLGGANKSVTDTN